MIGNVVATRAVDALVLDHVEAGYGALGVLRDVSLTVPECRVVALIGPNGAGKSTLLRVASGLLKPWAGRIVLDGDDVTGWPPDRRASAGVCHVPEGRGVFPGLTVRENLILQSDRRTQHTDVASAIEAFPILGQRLSQLAGTMSGGQQQMLALARAYVSGARVILLDEVSLGLAPVLVDQIYESIRELVARGVSMLLVEQYASRALAIADEVYLLGGGAVRFHGPPNRVDEDGLLRSYLGAAPG